MTTSDSDRGWQHKDVERLCIIADRHTDMGVSTGSDGNVSVYRVFYEGAKLLTSKHLDFQRDGRVCAKVINHRDNNTHTTWHERTFASYCEFLGVGVPGDLVVCPTCGKER